MKKIILFAVLGHLMVGLMLVQEVRPNKQAIQASDPIPETSKNYRDLPNRAAAERFELEEPAEDTPLIPPSQAPQSIEPEEQPVAQAETPPFPESKPPEIGSTALDRTTIPLQSEFDQVEAHLSSSQSLLDSIGDYGEFIRPFNLDREGEITLLTLLATSQNPSFLADPDVVEAARKQLHETLGPAGWAELQAYNREKPARKLAAKFEHLLGRDDRLSQVAFDTCLGAFSQVEASKQRLRSDMGSLSQEERERRLSALHNELQQQGTLLAKDQAFNQRQRLALSTLLQVELGELEEMSLAFSSDDIMGETLLADGEAPTEPSE